MPLLPDEPLDFEAVGEDAPHEAAVVLVLRVPDGLLLGQASSSLPPRWAAGALAPWIVRPASPSARAGTMMAAIRTKFEVALERSRFPESDWTVVGITAAYLLTAPSQQLADMPA